jgi:hypothetical protein
MKAKKLLVIGMSLFWYSAVVQAYSQEELNRVELPREEMTQTAGATGQRQVPEVVVNSGITDNKNAVPDVSEKVPGPLSRRSM